MPWSPRVILVLMGSESILVWNVRGLNTTSHRDAVHELVFVERPSIVCLQETKKVVILDFDITQLLGVGFDYVYLPIIQTCGGILVAWRILTWSVSSSAAHRFSVSIKLRHIAGGVDWWISSVYGPSQDQDKPEFLSELHDMRSFCSGPWLLNGDFNLIYRVGDQNNARLNRHLMGQFHFFLNDARFKEIHLNGR
jgi:exonuclease III